MLYIILELALFYKPLQYTLEIKVDMLSYLLSNISFLKSPTHLDHGS